MAGRDYSRIEKRLFRLLSSLKLPDTVFSISSASFILILTGLFLSGFSLYIFAELVELALQEQSDYLDNMVFNFIHSFDSDGLDRVMHLFTETGSIWWIGFFTLVLAVWLHFYKKDFWVMVFFVITMAGGGLLNKFLKYIFQRARPEINPGIDAVGFSFPSGHAMGSMFFYGFLGYMVIRSQESRVMKVLLSILLAIFILMIGISRIYLRAHFATDVIAGYAAGIIWLTVCITAMEYTNWRRKKKRLPNLDDES